MATIDFKVTFDYANSLLKFEDVTDWAAQSISKSDVNGAFKVVTPDGNTFYEAYTAPFTIETDTAQAGGTANITLAAGASSTTDYYKGLYVQITGGTGSGQALKVTAYNGTTKVATVASNWSTPPDGTSTYKIVFADIFMDVDLNNQREIQVPLTANNQPLNGSYTITYTTYDTSLSPESTLTQTFELCYNQPTIDIEQTVDCISPLFTSKDDTDYVVDSVTPTVTRVHKIYYPAGSPLANTPTTGSAATITTGVFYTGIQQTQLNVTLSYNFVSWGTGGMYVYDELDGGASIDVECDNRLCDIFCCVITLYNKMNKYKCKNEILYKEALDDFTLVMALVTLAREAWNCGKDDKLNTIISQILDVAECEEGCGCADGTPQQITGLGASVNIVEVTSAGSPINVTPTVVGNTTTYQVGLDQSFINKVNNLAGTSLTTATPTYLTITSSGTDPVVWNIDFSAAAIASVTAKDEITFKVTFDYPQYLGSFVTVYDEEITPSSGSNFNSPTIASVVTPANLPTFKFAQAIYRVSSFMNTPDDNYKVFLHAVPRQATIENNAYTESTIASALATTWIPQVINVQSGQFDIVMVPTGKPQWLLHNSFLNIKAKFDLHITIKK